MREDYEAKLDQLISGPFNKIAVDAKLDAWAEQLSSEGYPVQPSILGEFKAALDRRGKTAASRTETQRSWVAVKCKSSAGGLCTL